MKFVAFYLPQFHEIPENNTWWGKGFTDWVNVKKAKPFFKGHRQPRVPLGDDYYDLSNIETIKKQALIAEKYGIYGFCFYHYWFNGKLLLEKPVELLLNNKDVNLRYCFSWANESWARTWDGKNREYLIKQDYGDKKDWVVHFNYFLDFFKDERYIKINGKPVLLIYKYSLIPNFEEMISLWSDMAKKAGFPGIYLVETLRDKSESNHCDAFDAHVEFEPARSINTRSSTILWYERVRRLFFHMLNKVLGTKKLENKNMNFSDITNVSLAFKNKKNTFGGIFLGWDNSPRKTTRATIILEPSEEELIDYIEKKIDSVEKNNDSDNQFIFINAWNEWAEGTYLEPDTINKFKYLEIIKRYSEN